MAIPKPKKSAEDFIKGAAATKAETVTAAKGDRGRPPGPEKKPLNVKLPVGMLKAIKENSNGNMSFLTEQLFKEYFDKNGIKYD
ncbi:hypothetical protein FCL47_22460 [Desulfopila sp. IMCC35006]|uniref:hypothetical protein n=1 Tax=Desulfopila sp. IMCC35006 TaxID=2569542 RepID=UPI0010AD6CC0|nr:hypothetical protein [Desulfopila sp. IMCC35006]TKB23518.1 hypothetical protein FCL47_22460 [Desulfopila sp. IMCC35006]